MSMTSQEQAGLLLQCGSEALQNGSRTTFKRLWMVYRCQRRRNKNLIEIVLEGAAKLSLNNPVPAALLKIFSRRYHHQITDRTLESVLRVRVAVEQFLGREKLLGANFFVNSTDESMWKDYRDRFRAKCRLVVEEADKIARHEFDFLGSGPCYWGELIDWHLDPKSGYRWPKKFYKELLPVSPLTNDADVKLPWELSRMQHLLTLGQGYRLTGDELYARELVAQITHWLDDNPCLVGVNWTCAMEVSIRIVNVVWGLAFIEGSSCVTADFKRRVLMSIWQHGQYLVRHLEYSIRPDGQMTNHNHYLSNIVGLVYLSLLFPEFKAAKTWWRIGIKGMVQEMERQVHADGVDYESSTSYHRLVLELFTSAALLCRLNGVQLPSAFWKRLEEMYSFILHVTRPDGKAPQVGDVDDGRLHILSDYGLWDRTDHRYLLSIGATLFHRPDMKAAAKNFSQEAFWLLGGDGARRFDAISSSTHTGGSKAFQEAGFYVMRSGTNYLMACCNRVGTAGTGNHKHNDLLSFELYAGDKAFIVDPGTYVYTSSAYWRNLFRSTEYHNTVVIDGQEQNRFDPGKIFEMTPDSDVIIHEWISTSDVDRLDAEHTGYSRLDPPVRHRRTFVFLKRKGTWEIIDAIQGEGIHTADWYFHFDSGVDLARKREQTFRTRCKGTNLELEAHSDIPLLFQVLDGWVSSRYGQKTRSRVLHIRGKFNSVCRTVVKMKTV
jgi:Heparinase II/III-like protein/Heparinase II/III N-terminus